MAHVVIGNGRANLTLDYNTPYNVSVVFVADYCGGLNNATTILVVNYGKHCTSMIISMNTV